MLGLLGFQLGRALSSFLLFAQLGFCLLGLGCLLGCLGLGLLRLGLGLLGGNGEGVAALACEAQRKVNGERVDGGQDGTAPTPRRPGGPSQQGTVRA